ncbi:hypothetical protein [Zunongwangia pacifica]|uniref:Lipoprotein n=1 Tax=Zunongwangia pacifica TaxID=2911062 RepID=A0A9X2CKX6_9FLAO|nr:hypothetical protein [Zunongwangia pacifica]MCL6217905.1 hypothetical protein [Zunongwangia pacifica]
MSIDKLVPILFLILLFTSCATDDAEVVIENLSYDVFFENQLSYSEGEKIPKQYQLFTNREDWLAFIPTIERVNPDRAENLRNIEFDFANNNLIIVIGQFFNSCCTKISISRIYKRNDNLIVEFEESEPGMLAALSQTYLLLKTPKT